MLEIAIWGISLMLIVKAFDVLHREYIARATQTGGSPALAWVTFAIALVGALFLIWAANAQTEETQGALPSFSTLDSTTLGDPSDAEVLRDLEGTEHMDAVTAADNALAAAARAVENAGQSIENAEDVVGNESE